jgi:iron complex outermembrane recepter protein
MRILFSLALSLTAVSNSHSDTNTPEHVIVTAPFQKSQSETALPITVLTGEALQRDLANTLGETLNNSPGLSNASFGPAVGQPVIRGQQGPRVKVLQNSTGAADASNVSADHAVSVEPILADSIEVIRGPATLLYGNGAIGGVVNVIDNRIPDTVPEQTTSILEMRYGTAAEQGTAVARVDGGSGSFAFHLSGVYRDWNEVEIPGKAIDESAVTDPDHPEPIENTDGFIANSDGKTKSGTLGGSWVFDSGHFGIAYNRLDNEYGIPPGGHGHEEEHEEEHSEEHPEEHSEEEGEGIRIDVNSDRYDLGGEWRGDSNWLQLMRFKLAYTDYEHKEIEGNGEVGTVFSNENWETRFEAGHSLAESWSGVVGLQLVDSDFSAVGEEAFIPQSDTRNTGVFLIESLDLEAWVFEFGLRFENTDIRPSDNLPDQEFDTFSGSASALWEMTENWDVGVALSRAQRAPAPEELYSNANLELIDDCIIHAATQSCEIGNANLKEESSNNIDLSLHWHYPSVEGFITLYYNDFQDFIYLQNTGEEIDEQAVMLYDQIDAQFVGIEAEVNWILLESSSGNVSLSLFGDWIEGELQSNEDVPRLPPMRFGGTLDYARGPFGAYVRGVTAAEQDKPGVNETETDGYTRWDAGVDYHFELSGDRELSVFLKGVNLSDEEIRLSTSFLRNIAPEAGRSVELGFRLTL